MAKKLRQAGAIILGKTNLSQWANYRSNNSSNGWSAQGGQTYAAYYPNLDPSGSSSGSGVAASPGLALAALGTEVRNNRCEKDCIANTLTDLWLYYIPIIQEQPRWHQTYGWPDISTSSRSNQ